MGAELNCRNNNNNSKGKQNQIEHVENEKIGKKVISRQSGA